MRKERKLDQFLSVLVLLIYAAVIAIKWIMVYQDVNPNVIKALSILSTIILCLMFCVILYNALGWTNNIILKIVFIAITVFLIASAIAVQIPAVQQFFLDKRIPLII